MSPATPATSTATTTAAPDLSTRISDVLPLSPLQSGLFFHAVSGDPDVYRYQLALDIAGSLAAERFRRCADLLLHRHTALRTGFVAEDVDEPVGVVLDGLRMPWREVDLTRAADQDAELRALAAQDRTRPFTLDRPPLIRLTLARLAENRWRLLLTNHHLVLDGWSMPILLRELFTLYAAKADPDVLPAARPYRDHLAWLAARDQPRALAEWRRALDGLAGPTLIAPGHDDIQTPERREIPVAAALSARLAALARERGVTLNTVLQVLWALTLATATGTADDVVFGTTVNGRPAGSEDMVGLFINTLPVRVRFDPAETVAELLQRVQREQAALLDAQHVGLADIQRAVAGLPAGPLFDTLYVFESYPSGQISDSLAGTGLSVTPRAARDATHYPLVLVAAPGDPAVSLVLKYQPQAVSAQYAAALAERFFAAAEALADDPDRRLATIPAATAGELKALTSWNGTAAPVSASTLLDLVAAAAAANPDATAIKWDGGELTYRRLEVLANELAHRLRALGVNDEARVGLYLQRSPEFVIAALAVLRAGGAFVPLDPQWPALRVRGAIESAGVVAVCTAAEAEPSTDVPTVIVDLTAPGAETPPPTTIDGDQLAYVIHTSGSTGTPKGAMIRHRSIGNRLVWQAGLLGFGPGDAALFKAPLGFDISINEIFLPLTTGATLVIAAAGAERDIEALAARLVSGRISFCYLTSSMLAALLELPGFATAAGLTLRHVWCGGELLTPELYARFRSTVDATMYHGYGPAETTIGVTHEIYRPGHGRDGATIGRPNPNTRAYVLDRFLRPVPPGVVGELYVGGLLLGRGYVGDPRRTAERFVADPFGPPGERLYRTGDLAAWLADGRLRFAGRADNQVKIRGMRVEPEEVESQLAGHPDLGQSAVLALPDTSGALRLVAFCASRDGALSKDDLRRWSRERLPEHLVPAQFVVLPELPTHDSGKVNLSALAALAEAPRGESVPPRTPTEERVLTEFRAVLGREDIGVTDDFFSSGGHSLLAIRLVLAVRAALDTQLNVRTLLAHPSAAELAAYLDDASASPLAGLADSTLLPLRTNGSAAAPLFCVHGASGLALGFAGLLQHLPDRPVYGLQARSLRTDSGLPTDRVAMAAEYVAEIRAVQPEGPYHLLGFSLGGTIAHLMAGQLHAAGERVETLVLLDSMPAHWLPVADPDWTLERGLARLLRAEGYDHDHVLGDAIDPQRAGELVAAGTGGLSGFTVDDLCNVVLSWRHSATLTAPADTPVYDGDALLFVAAREGRGGYPALAELWQPLVAGTLDVVSIDTDHMGIARPGPLAEIATHLR